MDSAEEASEGHSF